MKLLKYISILLILIIIGFLLTGLIKPEVTYVEQITVDKPITESWAVTQDSQKLSQWLTGFKQIKHISGDPGTVGSVSDVYFVSDGTEMSIRETITSIVPGETITMTYTSDFMDMDYTMTMSPADSGTTIKTQTIAEGNNIMSKSIMALTSGALKEQEKTNLIMLKKVIEGNTKNYSDNQHSTE